MAAMVPMGIDFWASRKSPERLDPAMIPGEKEIKVEIPMTESDAQLNPEHLRVRPC